jgi:hypothetical protein
VGAVRRTEDATADELLAVARRWGLPRLLTPDESGRLLGLLGELPGPAAAAIPAAVRAALPLAVVPSALLNAVVRNTPPVHTDPPDRPTARQVADVFADHLDRSADEQAPGD